jgi:tryptophan synthase alpha chain
VLDAVAAIRRDCPIPIVLYVYFNLLHRVGLERFITDAARAGVDGLLILDLPPEESETYDRLMRDAGLCAIWLIAPTTPAERVSRIVARGSGFIYYVSREGVTGMQTRVADTIEAQVQIIRSHTSLPVAIGFGVSNAAQAVAVAQLGDAVVVGSAIVQRIADGGTSPELVTRVAGFVGELVHAVKAKP